MVIWLLISPKGGQTLLCHISGRWSNCLSAQGEHMASTLVRYIYLLICSSAHQEKLDLVEIVDGLLQGKEGRPLLQSFWKFAAPTKLQWRPQNISQCLLHHEITLPVAEVHQLVVYVLHVDLLPKDGEVPANNDYENGMVRIFKQCLTNIIILVKSGCTRWRC